MANSVDPDQTAPGSTLYASILNLSVMLGNYLQQTSSADNIFRCIFFLVLKGLRVCNRKSSFLIFLLKPMLWVRKRTVSIRGFY